MIFLIKHHFSLLFVCFVIFIFSCLGQTYFISWLNPSIQESYGLSRTTLGFVYSGATFASSFFLPTLGRMVDSWKPANFALLLSCILALGLSLLGFVDGVVGLFCLYLFIRMAGQMGMSLLGCTVIARKFGRHRGKALSLVHLGRPLGEAILPLLVISLLEFFPWYQVTMFIALGFLVIFFSFLFTALRSVTYQVLYEEREGGEKTSPEEGEEEFSRKKFYQDRYILLVISCNAILPFIFTGLFFQQTSLMEIKGWSPQIMGRALSFYGLMGVFWGLSSGFLIDRFSATRLLPLPTIPLVLAILTMLFGQGDWACFLYTGFLGTSMGFFAGIYSSFYGENFPLFCVGRAKSIDASYLVKITALAPLFFSFLLDSNISFSAIMQGLAGLVTAGFFGYWWCSRHYLQKQRVLK